MKNMRLQIPSVLKAYAFAEPLVQVCVDPRYKYVSKGCAPTFEQLSGKWAVPGYSGYSSLEAARVAKDSYGDHIIQLIERAVKMEVAPVQPDQTAPEGMRYVVQAGEFMGLANARKTHKLCEELGIVTIIKLYEQSNKTI